jgi:hypothetical protein
VWVDTYALPRIDPLTGPSPIAHARFTPSGKGSSPVRTTPIPPLSELPLGFTIQRCSMCDEWAFADEICRTDDEALVCRSRVDCDVRVRA